MNGVKSRMSVKSFIHPIESLRTGCMRVELCAYSLIGFSADSVSLILCAKGRKTLLNFFPIFLIINFIDDRGSLKIIQDKSDYA